jgi:hypothetical protein
MYACLLLASANAAATIYSTVFCNGNGSKDYDEVALECLLEGKKASAVTDMPREDSSFLESSFEENDPFPKNCSLNPIYRIAQLKKLRGNLSISWIMEKDECDGVDCWRGTLTHHIETRGNFWNEKKTDEIGWITCYKLSAEYASIMHETLNSTTTTTTTLCNYPEVASIMDDILDIDTLVIHPDASILESSAALKSAPKLLISSVEVLPIYAGIGLGLYMVDTACRKINDEDSLTVVACTTSSDSGGGMNTNTKKSDGEIEASLRQRDRMRAYFGTLCFRDLGNKYCARWTGYDYPMVQDLCPHLFSPK